MLQAELPFLRLWHRWFLLIQIFERPKTLTMKLSILRQVTPLVASLAFGLLFFSTPSFANEAASETAPVTFRAFARTFSPNQCSYYNTIEGEVIIQTIQKKSIGELSATAELHKTSASRYEQAWNAIQAPLNFETSLTDNQNYLYSVRKSFTISSRGSFAYDKLRFQAVQNTDGQTLELPSNDSRLYYVVDLAGLSPACDPNEDNFVERPVMVRCMEVEGLAPCSSLQ